MTVDLGLEKERHATGQIEHVDRKTAQSQELDKLPNLLTTLGKNLCTKAVMARELESMGLTVKAIERVLNIKAADFRSTMLKERTESRRK